MCSEVLDPDKLLEELEAVCRRLDELLKDLEWRKPDVEAEEAKLAELMELAKNDPMVDVASQAIAVRVLRAVLDDKIQEAHRLEARMLELQAQLDALVPEAPLREEEEKGGEALR